MPEPTPGPWHTVDHGKGAIWIEDENGTAIASLPDWLPEVGNPRDANARLMAAAPDLLAALTLCVIRDLSLKFNAMVTEAIAQAAVRPCR